MVDIKFKSPKVLPLTTALVILIIKIGFESRWCVVGDEFKEPSKMDYGTLMDQRRLVVNEQKLIQELLEYTRETEEVVSGIKKYISTYTSLVLEPLKPLSTFNLGIGKEAKFIDLDLYVENLSKDPFLAFPMMTRFAYDFPILLDQMEAQSKSEKSFRSFLTDAKRQYKFPSRYDLDQSMTSLTYLIILYDLNLDDLSDGKILDDEVRAGNFTVRDFYDFGNFAERREIFTLAINLLEKAQSMLDISASLDVGASENQKLKYLIEKRLSLAIRNHNEAFHANSTDEELLDQLRLPNPFLFPEEIIDLPETYGERKLVNFRSYNSSNGTFEFDENTVTAFHIFPELCQGKKPTFNKKDKSEETMEAKNEIESPPKCFLQVNHPYWTIGPVKVEILSKDPFIVQYHEVVTDGQIETIKEQLKFRLERSRVVTMESSDATDSSRLSSTTVAGEDEAVVWNKKVELITGLGATKFSDSEMLQVTNYATGAHFLPHLDAFGSGPEIKTLLGDEMALMGDRLATFMFYLSPVKSGGRTVFPLLGVTAEALQGSALFWYNLHPDGTLDDRLLHGGCPILYGTKWIATKWIRSNDQMFRQKCSLQKTQNATENKPLVAAQNSGKNNYWYYNGYRFEN